MEEVPVALFISSESVHRNVSRDLIRAIVRQFARIAVRFYPALDRARQN